MYSSKDEADKVVKRMQDERVPGWKRLNSYKNQELQGWFVGKRGKGKRGK